MDAINKDLVTDTTAPAVSTVSSTKSNGSYKAGDSIDVTVKFSEAGTITGTVKNADGTPFRAAFVRVQNTKTRMTMMVVSDRQGRYFTDELAPGAYQVWATSVGYKSEPSRRVSVTIDEKGRQSVDFTMQTSAVQWSQLTKFQAGAAA
jgi:hypothetical protein